MANTIIDCLLSISQTCSLIWDILSTYNGFDDNVQLLRGKLDELCSQESDIKSELEHAELQQGKKRKRQVKDWLRNVQRKKTEVYGIEQELRDGGLLTQVKLTGQVMKLTRQMEELVNQGRFPGGLVLCASKTKGYELLTTKLVGEMFQKNVGRIWNWLTNNEVLTIGVYGMGGVGKTTLLMHIHNMLLTSSTDFDYVFWVTVSQSSSVCKLQNDVAKVIGLNISKENDERKRASRLSWALMRRKRCVLILDDLWSHFPAEKVGIPVRVHGLKLILTSRSSDVCRRMSCQKCVKVEPLSDNEAWKLFVLNLGEQTTLSSKVKKVAKSVVKECAGLPLAVITVARSMRGVEDICEWRHALEELRTSKTLAEMEMEVFHVLRFSYARLNDNILQQCFLYCTLYPEDSEIDREVLIESFVDEGLIDGMKSLEAIFDEGHTILNKLENNCLLGKVEKYVGGNKCTRLQDSSSHIAVSMMKRGSRYMAPVKNVEGYYVESQVVKMHDLLWAMARKIMKEKHHFMVKAGLQLTEIPDEQEWTEELEKVSLMWNWIHDIPAGMTPRCPKLKTLILKHNESLTWISDSFFFHMSSLQVLDLSFTDIEVLPSSVSDLKTLTALLLTSCSQLRHLPSLAKLQALKRLDLSYTAITEMPQGLEKLINLRWLNLYAKNLKMSTGKEIAKLTHLQFLILHWWSRKMKVKVEDISGLRKLEAFAGNFYNMHHFNAYVKVMHSSGLKSYLLQLDTEESLVQAPQFYFTEACFSKDVIFTNCSLKTGEISLILPRDVLRLKVERCHNMRSLCDVLSLKNATSLRRCEIADCDEAEYLISLSCSSSCCTVPQNLESLELCNLKALRFMCKEDDALAQTLPLRRVFSCLKYLCIYHCPNIKKLLTPALLASLQNLEEITVHHCESMKEIISSATPEDVNGTDDESYGGNQNSVDARDFMTLTHSKLVSLSLKYLPELRSICKGVMICESLQNFKIFKCPKLIRFPQTVPPVQTLYDCF